MEVKNIVIGQEYRVIGGSHGGLGEMYQLGDIAIPYAHNGAYTFSCKMKRQGTNMTFRSSDLEETRIRLTIEDILSNSYALTKSIYEMLQSKVTYYENEKITVSISLKGLCDEAQNKRNRIIELDTLIRSQIAKSSNFDNIANNTRLFKLLFSSHYESIIISDYVITAITKPITINYRQPFDDKEHYDYDMGKYKINIPMLLKDIHITGIDKRIDLIHPHINSEGKPCWGTYEETVQKYKAEDRFPELLTLIYDFLSSVYPGGWYDPIYYWHKDASDMCHKCWNYSNDCECHNDEERCGDCNETYDNCSCSKCPLSNERLENNNFPDVGCIICPHLVKDENQGLWLCTYRTSTEHPNFGCNIDNFDPARYPGTPPAYQTITEEATNAS